MSLILGPGESTIPLQVPELPWRQLGIDFNSSADPQLTQEFKEAISPLVSQDLSFCYFKPIEGSFAFRVETKGTMAKADHRRVLATLSAQIAYPFIKEPVVQHLADLNAKVVSTGVRSLVAAVRSRLQYSDTPELNNIVFGPYRTEGGNFSNG